MLEKSSYKTFNMNYCPISDLYITVRQGINSCKNQLNCFGKNACVLYEKFQQAQLISKIVPMHHRLVAPSV